MDALRTLVCGSKGTPTGTAVASDWQSRTPESVPSLSHGALGKLEIIISDFPLIMIFLLLI